MDRLERFYRMQGLLRNRRFVRTQEFLEELGVSRATFKRDLEYLRDRMHAPIVYDRRPRGVPLRPDRSPTANCGNCRACGSRRTNCGRC